MNINHWQKSKRGFDMTYNSIYFILFLAVFFAVYFMMPKVGMKQCVILLGNIFFYRFAGGLNYLLIIVGTSLVVYIVGRLMDRVYGGYEEEVRDLSGKEKAAILAGYKKRCKKVLIAGLILVLGILAYIKAGRLLKWEEVGSLVDFRPGRIIVPLGVSYYTFSAVGYMLDIYWRKIKCEHNYLKLLMCMTFFPIMVEGPISKYNELIKQFNALPKFDYERVCFGLQLIVWGEIKKTIVADRLVIYSNYVFGNLYNFAGVEIVIAVLFNVISVYADFSGCIDIARGVAQVMGITLEQNFKQPFFSKSAAEFWRRWHITLGTWFKDYVYMPIAMSPKLMKAGFKVRNRFGARAGSFVSTAIPLAIVWILTGLWHGTGADYFAWGCYWGVLIIIGSTFGKEFNRLSELLHIDTETFAFQMFRMIRTFLCFCIGRMLTATGSLQGFVLIIRRLFSQASLWVLFDNSLYDYGLDQRDFYIALFGVALMWVVDVLQQKYSVREKIAGQPLVLRWIIYYAAIMFLLIFGMWGAAYDASSFVYGNF